MKQGVYCRTCDAPLIVPPADFPATEHFWPMPEHFWQLVEAARTVHTAATGHGPVSIVGMSFTGGFDTWPPEYRPQGFLEVPLSTDEEW